MKQYTETPLWLAQVAEVAVLAARQGPCAKSKRGVVLVSAYPLIGEARGLIQNSGFFNGPPAPFVCSGTAECAKACGQISVHAEARAVDWLRDCRRRAALVHVKIDSEIVDLDKKTLVAGGPPSCVTCSRAMLESGAVTDVFLYQANRSWNERPCLECAYIHRFQGLDDLLDCPVHVCGGRLHPVSKTVYSKDGMWHEYSVEEFHDATLANLGLPRTKVT